MGRRLVDQIDGISEYLDVDEVNETFTIEHVADVEPVVDDVAAKHAATAGKTEFGWHIASIPVVVLQSYAKERGIPNFWDLCRPEYADELVRFATDIDNRKLSPTGGKV